MNEDRADMIVNKLNNIVIYPKGPSRYIRRFRKTLKRFAMTSFFENFMTMCVVINTITLALDRYDISNSDQQTLILLNNIFTGIFITEMIFKVIGFGIKSKKCINDSGLYRLFLRQDELSRFLSRANECHRAWNIFVEVNSYCI